ncbi:hypothetical protein INS49_008334 [Diaporthe citri]|uniref:uncharacterized protein n=1 Tax=Diaporthe citri TaxID=83186 RepID=UPI001C80ECA4|nr:uncharacterized protein INS49_008334 [Diaporthe citri]KAG6363238.1 hypothetical protein INS49_008334 [Diaporthe citri]
MGVHISDSDSELSNEKGQTTTAHKRSRCPWILLVQILRKHQEKREQTRIEEIRMQVNKDREKIEAGRFRFWQGTTSTEQRRSMWEGGLDPSSLKCCGRTFSTSHTYKLTISSTKSGSVEIVIHDFRTPEGREEAFKWWDARYRRVETYADRTVDLCNSWEETYQKYIKEHHLVDRKILLKGGPKINWTRTKVEKLPN